jgi:hypothetical protein
VTCEGLRVKGLYWEAETEHLHAVFCSVLQCQLTSARSSQLPSGVNRRLDELRELLESADDEAWKGRKWWKNSNILRRNKGDTARK